MTDPVFVTCISRLDVARDWLLASPCLGPGGAPLTACFNAASAAAAFNPVVDQHERTARWVVWLHQDVRLPGDWIGGFGRGLAAAKTRWPALAVVGAYGVRGHGAHARRAGHLLDRGRELHEPEALPARVDSLDELLVAVRADAGLRMDPALGFDFYATDLVLQARRRGLDAAVIEGLYCEHGSDTPRTGPWPAGLVRRLRASAEVFEAKWASALPVTTPTLEIGRVGDVARLFDSLEVRT